jgi:uncharacterized membrane protein YkoI
MGRMFKIVALILIQLLAPYLAVVSDISISYAYADNDDSGRSHQRSIRNAVQQKQILPLGKIKQYIENKTKSEIIYIELEREHGQWVYEFKIVDRNGRLREIYVDATSGKILKSKTIEKRNK